MVRPTILNDSKYTDLFFYCNNVKPKELIERELTKKYEEKKKNKEFGGYTKKQELRLLLNERKLMTKKLKNLVNYNLIKKEKGFYIYNLKGIIEYMFKTYSKEEFLETDDYSEIENNLKDYFQILSNAYKDYKIYDYTLKEIIEAFIIGFDKIYFHIKNDNSKAEEITKEEMIKIGNIYEFEMKFIRLCNNFVHNHLHKQSDLTYFAIEVLND